MTDCTLILLGGVVLGAAIAHIIRELWTVWRMW